jgi:ATP-dependent exoDNAse (exonuclease V) beta subunit
VTAARTLGAAGLRLVSASAGSGKTTRLTQEVTRSLDPTASSCIDVEGLIAVTYTTKAQAELGSRLRRALVDKGEFTRAGQLPLAHLGTVHAVCLGLLKEFALDAGLSPAVDGLPQETARRLLQEALERALSPDLRRRLNGLSAAMQLNWDGRISRHDWISPVEDIMTLMRSNRLDPKQLPTMAQRSVAGILELSGPPLADAELLEQELCGELERAIAQVETLADGQKNTEQAVELMRGCNRELARGKLPWSQWCKLSKVAPGKRALPLVADVQRLAAQYEVHPRFQRQLRELCEAIFEAARVGLDAYAEWKVQRGLVDYIDMIDTVLSVLDVPEVAIELGQRLQLLVVDEFQDTSPVQLALFTRLHALCGRSIWVGDRKQCIFEYAGADPSLMESVTRWVGASGGDTEILESNYRSREELVNATSTLFASAFARHGHPANEVRTTAKRQRHPEQDALAPLGVWWLQPRKGAREADALAEGVQGLLADPSGTPVFDRTLGRVRPLRAGDIAILVASNNEADQLSAALKARGVSSVLPRTGLVTTPEGTLLSAALRYLVDRRDTLSTAEIEALLEFGGQSHETWLSERVRVRGAAGERDQPSAAVARLDTLRAQVHHLSPSEVVDRVLALLDMPALARRWPDPSQRMANLDALRGLTQTYEERCVYLREAASLAGLTRYFEETCVVLKRKDEERASDEQHVGATDGAVVLSTYHKAKGLEWPVVVLGSLGRERKRDAFEVTPETDRVGFDAADPLGGRWIRYWPWPLGQQRTAPLRDRAAESVVGKRITRRDARERARLLYVGFTRARDHLILGVATDAKGKPRVNWLNELEDDEGPLLRLPQVGATTATIGIRGVEGEWVEVPTRSSALTGDDGDAVEPAAASQGRTWFIPSAPNTSSGGGSTQFAIHPSNAANETFDLPESHVACQMRFTSRMAFVLPKDASWDQVGSALHAFLAADRVCFAQIVRSELARRVLGNAGILGAFEPDALIAASDALTAFVQERWPAAVWHREIPITATVHTASGVRRIHGTIDLLLETPEGVILIDHKSFPGAAKQWAEQAMKHAPQLLTYRSALEHAGHVVGGQWVHFTIGGGMVEIGAPGQVVAPPKM